MGAEIPCRLLEWDSEFFGLRIAQVTSPRLSAAELARVRQWVSAEAVDCLYYRVAADAPDAVQAAEAAGFRLVDIRVTLGRRLDPDGLPPAGAGRPVALRTASPGDVEALSRIARASHRGTRFYNDPRFPDDRCGALYATWIANSCAGFADRVWVANGSQDPAGYITCHVDADGAGRIGLVAVAEGARGRGVGPALVRAALAWFAEVGCKRVVVSTQGSNAPALQLYERMGFRTQAVEPWLHLWGVDV